MNKIKTNFYNLVLIVCCLVAAERSNSISTSYNNRYGHLVVYMCVFSGVYLCDGPIHPTPMSVLPI